MVQDRTSQSSSLRAEVLSVPGPQDFLAQLPSALPGRPNASKDELTKLLELAAIANVRLYRRRSIPDIGGALPLSRLAMGLSRWRPIINGRA